MCLAKVRKKEYCILACRSYCYLINRARKYKLLYFSAGHTKSPNSNPNSINVGATAGFAKRSAVECELFRASGSGLWRIFSLDSRTLNKISIVSALRLPTSKVICNSIDLGVKRYRIFNFFKNEDQNKKISTFKHFPPPIFLILKISIIVHEKKKEEDVKPPPPHLPSPSPPHFPFLWYVMPSSCLLIDRHPSLPFIVKNTQRNGNSFYSQLLVNRPCSYINLEIIRFCYSRSRDWGCRSPSTL